MTATEAPGQAAQPTTGSSRLRTAIVAGQSSLSAPPVSLRRANSLPARSPQDEAVYPPARRASVGDRPLDDAPLQASTGSNITPAMQVRVALGRRLLLGWSGLGGDTRFALAVKLFVVFGQLVAFAVVLGIYNSDSCDKPLQAWLIAHIVRSTLSYPLGFYVSLLPPTPSNSEQDTPDRRAAREARRVMGSPRWDARVRLASDLLLAFAVAWFVVGNYWLWTSSTCRLDAKPLFYSTLAALIVQYFYLAQVVVIVCAIVFFLPLAVLIMTLTGYGEKKHDIGPLSQQDIDALPIVLFKPAEEGEAAQATAAEPDKPAPLETPAAKPSKRPNLSRLLFRKRHRRRSKKIADSLPNGLPYPLHALPENLSTCPICLTDFETPDLSAERDVEHQELDLLTLLPQCGHCLHKECVAQWLKTSGRCPVCQTPVKPQPAGKKKADQTSDDNDTTVANDPVEI